jgi:carbamoyl-phosphate synthase small subunit
MQGWIALENGSVFFGDSFGYPRTVEGELVFNTSMTGYQEALTDPSYAGQILLFTFPQIGNYGCNKENYESEKIQTKACIVKEWCRHPHQGEENFSEWLLREKIPGLEGIDTRKLTIITRESGTLRAVISTDGKMTPEEGVKRAKKMEWPSDSNLVAEVSTEKIYKKGKKGPNVTLLDWGVKRSIVNNLAEKNKVTVVPWDYSIEQVRKTKPDLIFMSNGPGDPDHPEMKIVVNTVKSLVKEYPTIGICLGHQILGLALGGETYKLKYGHRGGNQPVKHVKTEKVYITSQNHGFALHKLPNNIKETFVNLNDGTCEGISGKNCWSVQFHPEAAPGPMDANVLFNKVGEMIDG